MSRSRSTARPGEHANSDFLHHGHDKLLGTQVRRAYITMRRSFATKVEPLGLTQTQCAALWLIDANPRISQSDLAPLLMLDRVTMVDVIDKLHKRGFLKREQSTADGRRWELLLSKSGKSTLAKAKKQILAIEREFSELFSEGELLVLLDRLKTVADNT